MSGRCWARTLDLWIVSQVSQPLWHCCYLAIYKTLKVYSRQQNFITKTFAIVTVTMFSLTPWRLLIETIIRQFSTHEFVI